MQQVTLLLLYAEDVTVIFSYDVDGMQCLLGALDAFCQSSGLTINVDKTKMMVVQTSSLTNTLCLHIRENIYNLYKALSILVSMYMPQINGVYALSLDFQLVGKVII